jgi:hypothetical protein
MKPYMTAPLILIAALAFAPLFAAAADAPNPAAASPAAVTTAAAPATAPQAAPASLDNRIQDLKGDVIRLNRDLMVLEEELLFPANTQVAVFVSMDVGDFFDLDSVQLRIDDKPVSNYLYTEREVEALLRGGVHRIYLGNLKTGEHELTAVFTGQGPHARDYRRGATLKVEKGIGAKFVELRISDRESKQQPEFLVKEWE